MFYKNKKPNEIRPMNQKPQEKRGIVVNKDAANNPLDNKDVAREKSAMRSGGEEN